MQSKSKSRNQKRLSIYNLLQKSKDKINLSNETISLNDSIEFLIKINIYNKTELDFREDIDLSIFIIKNFFEYNLIVSSFTMI